MNLSRILIDGIAQTMGLTNGEVVYIGVILGFILGVFFVRQIDIMNGIEYIKKVKK